MGSVKKLIHTPKKQNKQSKQSNTKEQLDVPYPITDHSYTNNK
jgi:hypothetical protein